MRNCISRKKMTITQSRIHEGMIHQDAVTLMHRIPISLTQHRKPWCRLARQVNLVGDPPDIPSEVGRIAEGSQGQPARAGVRAQACIWALTATRARTGTAAWAGILTGGRAEAAAHACRQAASCFTPAIPPPSLHIP